MDRLTTWNKVTLCMHILVCMFCFTAYGATAQSSVVTYPAPSVRSTSTQFSVTAAPVNGGIVGMAQQVPTFQFAPAGSIEYSFAQISFGGTVQFVITDLVDSTISSSSVSPLAFGYTGSPKGATFTFQVPQSRYLIVTINGRKLILFADALESTQASAGSGIENITASPYNVSTTGTADSTTPIQNAINTAGSESGTVYVPAGVYYVSRLTLPSNVTLYLAGGAVLRDNGTEPANSDFYKSSQKMYGKWLISTIPGSSNITIKGRGTIDGNGYYSRNTLKYLNTLIMPLSTSQFKIDGILAYNAGFWALTPALSSGVTIQNYKGLDDIDSSAMQEDDGIDINESTNVTVQHALIVSRDDSYSTKTWCKASTYYTSETAPALGTIVNNWGSTSQALSNVSFTDVVAWSVDDAFKIGNGICKNQSGVTFNGGYVYSATHAVDVAPTDGTPLSSNQGGTIDSITFENIDVEATTSTWANIDAATSANASITNLTYSNINMRSMATQSISVPATSPSPINTVSFSGITYGGTSITTQAGLNFNPANNALTGVTPTK